MYNRVIMFVLFFSSRRRHTSLQGDWSSDVCSSDLLGHAAHQGVRRVVGFADLVNFTSLVRRMTERQLAVMVQRFEALRSEERRVGKDRRSSRNPKENVKSRHRTVIGILRHTDGTGR